MAQLSITITNGVPPFTISLFEAQTGEAVTCTSGCGSSNATGRTITFTPISGSHNYKVRTVDSASPPCVSESLTGVASCTNPTAFPDFTLTAVQPVCNAGVLSGASIKVNNLKDGLRYKLVQGSGDIACSGATPVPGGATTIDFQVNAPAAGTTVTYTVRIWNSTGASCDYYADRQIQITSPFCQSNQTCNLSIVLGPITC